MAKGAIQARKKRARKNSKEQKYGKKFNSNPYGKKFFNSKKQSSPFLEA